MSKKVIPEIAVVGIDIGKTSFHVMVGMEACVGAHHLSRKLRALGHDARLMPAKYVRPYGCES